MGVSLQPETVEEVGDDNLDVTTLASLDKDVTPLEAGRSKLPNLELVDACKAAAAAAAAAVAAATLAVCAEFPHNDVDTPLVIVTLDPVGDGIDL